jgi:hypothetical protein
MAFLIVSCWWSTISRGMSLCFTGSIQLSAVSFCKNRALSGSPSGQVTLYSFVRANFSKHSETDRKTKKTQVDKRQEQAGHLPSSEQSLNISSPRSSFSDFSRAECSRRGRSSGATLQEVASLTTSKTPDTAFSTCWSDFSKE